MKSEYRRRSLPIKILILFTIVVLVLDVAITAIGTVVYRNKVMEEYERICSGISDAVASTVNGNHVKEWLEGRKTKEYENTEEKFINLMNSFADINNIRVCKMKEDNMQILFNIDSKTLKNSGLGTEIPYDDYLTENKTILLEGENVGAIEGTNSSGSFMAIPTVIKDTSNKVVAYVICEISTPHISNTIEFAGKLLAITAIVSVLIVLILWAFANKIFITPIDRIDANLRNFADDNELSEEDKEDFNRFKPKTGNVLTTMHNNFLKLIDDVDMQNHEIREFDSALVEKMRTILEEEDIIKSDAKNENDEGKKNNA